MIRSFIIFNKRFYELKIFVFALSQRMTCSHNTFEWKDIGSAKFFRHRSIFLTFEETDRGFAQLDAFELFVL